MGWTLQARNKLNEHILRGVPQVFPTTYYMAAFTTIPADDGTGGVEVSASWYTRQIVIFGTTVGGQTANTNVITFTAAATSALPQAVVGGGLLDSAIGGMMWQRFAAQNAIIVSVGQPFIIFPGQLIFSELPGT